MAIRKKREDFQNPDVITASEDYKRRFNGPLGEYMLSVQKEAVFSLLPTEKPLRILELGGAHGQLTYSLLNAGHQVVVHCSKEEGLKGLKELQSQHPELKLISSPPDNLPFSDDEFDVVVMVRFISHLQNWKEVIREAARVSRELLIFDYPTALSFNLFSPFFFCLKQRIEGNTRPYTVFLSARIRRELAACSYRIEKQIKQFFLPMALHRLWDKPQKSIRAEKLARSLGLTSLFGSPAVLAAKKSPKHP